MKQMKTLTVNGITYAVTDPTAPRIDDTVLGDAPWSAKKIVDTLCPGFTKTGNIVTCEPVEGYPLAVTADEAATTITRCGKNLLNITAESTTINGVTFTVNADGSVTASGTATANTNFPLATMTLPAGDYILSGCPSGGGFSTYMVFIQTGSEAVYATGTSKAFSSTDGTASRKVLINIQRNVTVTDLVFYPMIRAAALNKDYEPYNGGTFAPGDTIPALPGVNTLWAEAGQITVTGRTNPTYTGTEAGGTENVI